jgi:hypothetical protein
MIATCNLVVARKAMDDKPVRRVIIEFDREASIFFGMMGPRTQYLAAGQFAAKPQGSRFEIGGGRHDIASIMRRVSSAARVMTRSRLIVITRGLWLSTLMQRRRTSSPCTARHGAISARLSGCCARRRKRR